MELSSVRELKAALWETVLDPLIATVATRSLVGGSEGPGSRRAAPATLALGVIRRGRGQYALAVRVQRRALELGPELEQIRQASHGEVDVQYVGRVVKSADVWHRQRNRPLRIGGSVGHYTITAGTLGAFVRPRSGGEPLLLSNNHVLADENRGQAGDPILQQGVADGGRNPEDVVGTLARFVPMRKHGSNRVDAAVAALTDGIPFDDRELDGLGHLAGLGDVFLDDGDGVAKVGRTTGTTRGRVTAFELDNVMVAYDMGNLRFDNQIEIEGAGSEPFSRGGDSGSLIVTDDLRAVGLLFAGGTVGGTNGKGLTYAHPLHAVLDALEVDLLI
jgi:hypothetical protein